MKNQSRSAAPATVVTDAPEYARALLREASGSPRSDGSTAPAGCSIPAGFTSISDAFFANAPTAFEWASGIQPWRNVVISGFSAASQYDRLIRLARGREPLPDGLACVARSGHGFQGFRGRSWIAEPGNLHLSVHLAPGRPIERFETIFMALAALSVVDAIDSTGDLRGAAGIRWVNDIVIGGAKVAGVLAYTQTRGSSVTGVILGIGLNVEHRPAVPPTAFVPEVACLRDRSRKPTGIAAGAVLGRLLEALGDNYETLLARGWRPLMQRYRERSIVIGREVAVSHDEPDEQPRVFASGRVDEITDGMELRLAGTPEPINRGRLILPAQARMTTTPDLTRTLDIAS